MFRDDSFDVVTVSQALHWLDDVQVCRGLVRLLPAAGHFFVIHCAIELDDAHPLAYVLGRNSVLGAKPGAKPEQVFAAEVLPLQRRLTLLFEALDAPDVQRIDPGQNFTSTQALIRPAGVALFRQTRPFVAGLGHGSVYFGCAFKQPASSNCVNKGCNCCQL